MITGLVRITRDGQNELRGTWIHPKIAIDFARWISPKFSVAVTDLVVRFLSGDVTTQESQAARENLIEEAAPKGKGKGKSKVTKTSFGDTYVEGCWLYVRCYHKLLKLDDNITPDEKVTLLNYLVLKFGRTGVLHQRHSVYSKDQGFFQFAFQCVTHAEARHVEGVVRRFFEPFTVGSKNEYLDVMKLAAFFEVYVDEAGPTEAQYELIAKLVYQKILSTIKEVNRKSCGLGFVYEPTEILPAEGSSQALQRVEFVRREVAVEDLPPPYSVNQRQEVNPVNREMEVEKLRIGALERAMQTALMNPEVDTVKLGMLLEKFNNPFPHSVTSQVLTLTPESNSASEAVRTEHQSEEAASEPQSEEDIYVKSFVDATLERVLVNGKPSSDCGIEWSKVREKFEGWLQRESLLKPEGLDGAQLRVLKKIKASFGEVKAAGWGREGWIRRIGYEPNADKKKFNLYGWLGWRWKDAA